MYCTSFPDVSSILKLLLSMAVAHAVQILWPLSTKGRDHAGYCTASGSADLAACSPRPARHTAPVRHWMNVRTHGPLAQLEERVTVPEPVRPRSQASTIVKTFSAKVRAMPRVPVTG